MRFRDLPEAMRNTLVVAQRCAFMAPNRDPILPSLAGDREAEAAQLARDARDGLDARLALYAELTDEERQTYIDRLDFEVDVITQMGFPGYFLIVADFIKWAKAQRYSGRAGARVGRGFGRRLGADDHRSRSAQAGPAVRTLPQPRTRVDARLRHRFLRNAARRGDPLCAGKIWPRHRRADHHLREAEGARGAQGHRARAADELWPGRPAGEAGAQPSDRSVDARPRAERRQRADDRI